MDFQSILGDLLDAPERYFDHPDPAVRRLAVTSWAPTLEPKAAVEAVIGLLADDEEEAVRAAAAEKLGALGGAGSLAALGAAVDDASGVVVEAVATALGEIGDASSVAWLIETATGHEDKLVREAAIASLGAIGDPAALPLLLETIASGPPQLRRRAIVAASVFIDQDAQVEAAITAALDDRNPSVREAAEMVVGRPVDGEALLQIKPC